MHSLTCLLTMSSGRIHVFHNSVVCESHEPMKNVCECFTSTKQGTELGSLVQFFDLCFPSASNIEHSIWDCNLGVVTCGPPSPENLPLVAAVFWFHIEGPAKNKCTQQTLPYRKLLFWRILIKPSGRIFS